MQDTIKKKRRAWLGQLGLMVSGWGYRCPFSFLALSLRCLKYVEGLNVMPVGNLGVRPNRTSQVLPVLLCVFLKVALDKAMCGGDGKQLPLGHPLLSDAIER